MNPSDLIFKELVKKGYSSTDGCRSWDIADRKFLYFTKELVDGFLKFQSFDKYKTNVIDREVNLVKEKKEKICGLMGDEPVNLIDVCCGDGKKVVELLKALPCKKDNIRYCPVNVSDHLVDMAVKNVESSGDLGIAEYKPHVGEWNGRAVGELAASIRSNNYRRNVILLLGSVLASFDINDYLFELSKGMFEGDYLIIGNGIRVGERLQHLKSYQHETFNNWFMPLVNYMGLKKEDVSYDARFGNSRVEFFYTLNGDKSVSHEGHDVKFKKGDEILVAYLYKYYEEELKKFCEMYFSKVEIVKDKENEYALLICKK